MENFISLLTTLIYLIPSLLILVGLVALFRRDSHYSVVLMMIAVVGKLLTDSLNFITVVFGLISFKTDMIIPFFNLLDSFSLVYSYTFGISFLIFIIHYRKTFRQPHKNQH
ncbi:hypothetical protein [Chryseobacterium sp.]|uniref:hypothetical protein n=1 Tax=Chryseobacterium sp. TaxID=1871047 RepID=UPI0028A03FC2|nr:hypothetical protein [Chryseobacterium sp.]